MGGCCCGPASFFKPRKTRKEVEFGCWCIRDLGAPCRMALEYAGASYTDTGHRDGESFYGRRTQEILKRSPLPGLPYLIDGKVTVCHVNSVLQYIGEKYNLSGDTPEARRHNDQLLCEVYEVRNNMVDLVYPSRNYSRNQEEYETNARELCRVLPFAKFEEILAQGGTGFLSGGKPLTADFHLWEMLDQHKLLAESLGISNIFSSSPHIKAFYDRVRGQPKLEKYFASDAYSLPINKSLQGVYFT